MADIGKKVKETATKAAKDKVSGEKKGKGTGGSKSGMDKAESPQEPSEVEETVIGPGVLASLGFGPSLCP
jgi:hypothetical protein